MHISDHLPADTVRELERLQGFRSVADIEANLAPADALFAAARAALREKYGARFE
jgi:hypothetical protein